MPVRIELSILLPVDGHRDDLGCALPEQSSQYFQRLLGCDTADSQQREARGETLAANRIRESLTGPGAPVDAQGRLALGLPVMRQCIQESVGGGIVPLAGLAQHGTGGREEYEEVQGIVLEQAMQQPARPSPLAARPYSVPPHRVAPAVRPAALPPRARHPGSAANPRRETRPENRAALLHRPHRPTPDARLLPRIPVREWR